MESKDLNTERKQNDFEALYKSFNVKDTEELYDLFFTEDQKALDNGSWDYNDSQSIVNKIKSAIELHGLNNINTKDLILIKNILWLWYHHATSVALFNTKDKKSAQDFVSKALDYKSNENPNQITELLNLLANEKIEEAKDYLNLIKDENEKQTASNLVNDYEKLFIK